MQVSDYLEKGRHNHPQRTGAEPVPNLSRCRLEIAHRRFVVRCQYLQAERQPRHVDRTTQEDGADEKVIEFSHFPGRWFHG